MKCVFFFIGYFLAFQASAQVFSLSKIDKEQVDSFVETELPIVALNEDIQLGDLAEELLGENPDIKARYTNVEIYIKELKEWNPHLKNDLVLGGTKIYYDYPYPYSTGYKLAPQLSVGKGIPKTKKGRWSLFGFYTASKGDFSESLKSSPITINFEQNSPYTIGLGSTYKFGDAPWLISNSGYISALSASSVGNNNTSIDIPEEIGVTLYGERTFTGWLNGVYAGFDFERFSTFNVEQLESGEDLRVREHQMFFVTLGLTKFLPTKIGNFLFKTSYSRVVSSSIKSQTTGVDAFEGNKFIVYANYKPFKKLLFHLLYKQHDLDGGVSDLEVKRLGVGIGWSFL